MIDSDVPALYTSAVSMSVPPASTYRSRMACEVGSSASAPNVIVPRAKADTMVPLFPRVLRSMPPTLASPGGIAYRLPT
jgi:hypothetical protein